MSNRKMELGPTGEDVAVNIQRLRNDQHLTYAELSRRLDEVENPIPPLGLRRIEAGERRVHVDDLMALAYVFQVSPAYLLMPHTPRPDDVHAVTAFGTATAHDIWQWIQSGTLPLQGDDAEQFDASISSARRSVPYFERIEKARHIAEQIRQERADHLDTSQGPADGDN